MTSPRYGRLHSSRNPFEPPLSLMQRFLDAVPWGAFDSDSRHQARIYHPPRNTGTRGQKRAWRPRNIAKVPLALIVIWVTVLWWGERTVFRHSIAACDWDNWEKWPDGAAPHHVVLIADPQLVDPHTYPGRPWPLSTLTTRHTDLYLRRSFSLLNKALYPDTLFFLGDLFDGGREWATRSSESPEPRFKRYGEDFWLREYDRFGRIFFKNWEDRSGHQRDEQRGRKIVTGLPGNHDLGLGIGIQRPVRARFNAFFGDGNAINIIGNHTFVSVDTVSLSAKGQLDPENGRQGFGSGEDPNADIWKPVDEFLDIAKEKKGRILARELRFRAGEPEYAPQERAAVGLYTPSARMVQTHELASTELPAILLTHVPIYRAEGTPCGPLRERWPPARKRDGIEEPLEKDEANAIAVQAGYQYQNVLTPVISSELIEKIGNVQHVFSGDDHDYCEVVHRGYTSKGGGIREITVKSMSWAMGVRKPGFLMLSLWNPIDGTGNPITPPGGGKSTLESHLCLLPDQLSIFIRYGQLLALTLIVLIVRGVIIGSRTAATSPDLNGQLLPLSKPSDEPEPKLQTFEAQKADSSSGSSSLGSPMTQYHNSLAVRATAGRPRSTSRSGSYGIPIVDAKPVQSSLADEFDRFGNVNMNTYNMKGWDDGLIDDRSKRKHRGRFSIMREEIQWGVWRVTWVAVLWYIWLVWSG